MSAFNKYVTVIMKKYILIIINETIISVNENKTLTLKHKKFPAKPNKRKSFSKTNAYSR